MQVTFSPCAKYSTERQFLPMKYTNEPIYIYVLSDPREGVVRYVGQSHDPENRIRTHLSNVDYCKRTKWVMGLIRDGYTPVMDIIEAHSTREEADEAERRWIKHFLDMGIDLVNSQLSGTGYDSLKLASKRIPPTSKIKIHIPSEKKYINIDRDLIPYMNESHWLFVFNQFIPDEELSKFLASNAELIYSLYTGKFSGLVLPYDFYLIDKIQELGGWIGLYIDTDEESKKPLLKIKGRVFSDRVFRRVTFRNFKVIFTGANND